MRFYIFILSFAVSFYSMAQKQPSLDSVMTLHWNYSIQKWDTVGLLQTCVSDSLDRNIIHNYNSYNAGNVALKKNTHYEYAFDKSNRIKSATLWTYNEVNNLFERIHKYEYEYDKNDYVVNREYYIWNKLIARFVIASKVKNEFDDSKRLLLTESYFFDNTGTTIRQASKNLKRYSIDTLGLTESTYYKWDVLKNNWIGDHSSIYILDTIFEDHGSYIENSSWDKTTNQWVSIDKTEYRYQKINGSIKTVGQKKFDWNQLSQQWTGRIYKNEIYNDSGALIYSDDAIWNTGANTWSLILKRIVTYNQYNSLISDRVFDKEYNSTLWKPRGYKQFVYNANNQTIQEVRYEVNHEKLELYYKRDLQYNSHGHLTLETTQSYSKLLEYFKYDYSYDVNNRILKMTIHKRTGNQAWVYFGEFNHTYFEESIHIVEKKYKNYDWIKIEEKFNDSGWLLERVSYGHNAVDWVKEDKYVFEYHKSGKYTLQVSYKWNENLNEWRAENNWNKIINAYDVKDNKVLEERYVWKGSWKKAYKEEWNYNNQNEQILNHKYLVFNNEWHSYIKEVVEKSTYFYKYSRYFGKANSNNTALIKSKYEEVTYDINGRAIKIVAMEGTGNDNQWKTIVNSEYTYHNGYKSRPYYNWHFNHESNYIYNQQTNDYFNSQYSTFVDLRFTEFSKNHQNLVASVTHSLYDNVSESWYPSHKDTFYYFDSTDAILKNPKKESKIQNILLYPNPNKGSFKLDNIPEATKSIQILNLEGKLIKEYQGTFTELTMPYKGLFMVSLLDKDKKVLVASKVLVQ